MSEKLHLGKRDGEQIYYYLPSWNCGWYWGFGYLGNENLHYHLDKYSPLSDINDDMELVPAIKKNLWKFWELVKTAYVLREAAEVLGRGGAHITNNPCQSVIKNKEEVTRINEIVLPSIFKEIELCFEP